MAQNFRIQVVVLSDKRAGDFLFSVYKDWVDIGTGLVYVPRTDRKKDADNIQNTLITTACAREAVTVPWTPADSVKSIQLKLAWTKYCVKVLYNDFRKCDHFVFVILAE